MGEDRLTWSRAVGSLHSPTMVAMGEGRAKNWVWERERDGRRQGRDGNGFGEEIA